MDKFSVALTLDERDFLVEGLKKLREALWHVRDRETRNTIDLLTLRLELMEMEGVA
jgi:hypothetical protein